MLKTVSSAMKFAKGLRWIQTSLRSLEQYLRAFVHDRPYTWAAWLHLSEFWFSTNYHNSAKMTPFVALYGYHPLKLLDYILGTT